MIVYSPRLSILYSNLNLSMFVYIEEATFTFIFIIIKTMAVTQKEILKMKEKFNEFLESIDDSNAFYIKSQQHYDELISEVELAKLPPSNSRSSRDKRRLNRYDVIIIDGTKKLFKPINNDGETPAMKYYLH